MPKLCAAQRNSQLHTPLGSVVLQNQPITGLLGHCCKHKSANHSFPWLLQQTQISQSQISLAIDANTSQPITDFLGHCCKHKSANHRFAWLLLQTQISKSHGVPSFTVHKKSTKSQLSSAAHKHQPVTDFLHLPPLPVTLKRTSCASSYQGVSLCCGEKHKCRNTQFSSTFQLVGLSGGGGVGWGGFRDD